MSPKNLTNFSCESVNASEEPDHLVERIDGYKEVGKYNNNQNMEFPVDVIEIMELKKDRK